MITKSSDTKQMTKEKMFITFSKRLFDTVKISQKKNNQNNPPYLFTEFWEGYFLFVQMLIC